MPGMLDLLFLKSGAKDVENEGERAYLLMFEKASMLLVLFLILMTTVALNFPGWAVGLIVGASLGPVVYGHYYINYIRRPRKRQNIDLREGKHKRNGE
ncbi:MAG: hypothetical protein ACPGKR_00610 [Poseidonia sp.]